MTRLRQSLLLLLFVTGCGPQLPGGITAHLVFEDDPGSQRQALTAAAVPNLVGRLEIRALVNEEVVSTTLLDLTPETGEELLLPQGGTWTLREVPVGTGRSVTAQAFLGPDAGNSLSGTLAYQGRIDGIEVTAGQITNAGVLTLEAVPNQDRELDRNPPDIPNPVTVTPVPAGEALDVAVTPPAQPDLVGYLVAFGASTSTASPTLDRKLAPMPGDTLVPGIVVHSIWTAAQGTTVRVDGLDDDTAYRILVYAYDGDAQGQPLNYSQAGLGFGTPTDTAPPGAPTALTAQNIMRNTVSFSFVAPGEDGAEGGRPKRYEMRTGLEADLLDPTRFAEQRAVTPPDVADAGQTVTLQRTWTELGWDEPPPGPVFVGIRAVDAAENAGEIATVSITPAVNPPAIVVPPIAVAGQELVITGQDLGPTPGEVHIVATETATLTYALEISGWTNTAVTVNLPSETRTGRLTLTKADGLMDEASVVVFGRQNDVFDQTAPPFELIGTNQDRSGVTAIYLEEGRFSPYESALQRIFLEQVEGQPFEPQSVNRRADALAGTYGPAYERFLFVVADQDLTMSTVLVSTATETPVSSRLPIGVQAGGADRVDIEILAGGTQGAVPAMITFTRDGVVRTATVNDAALQPFEAFTVYSSTIASYDRVTMAKKNNGELLMAYRAITPETTQLLLRSNPVGLQSGAFEVVPAENPPPMGIGVEVVSAPEILGGPERFLIVYQAIEPDDRWRIRLLWADDYGNSRGFAPLPPSDIAREIGDVGLVVKDGKVHLALALVTRADDAELSYVEIPIEDLSGTPTEGNYVPSLLDVAPVDNEVRMSCKPFAQRACAMLWMSVNAQILYVRR